MMPPQEAQCFSRTAGALTRLAVGANRVRAEWLIQVAYTSAITGRDSNSAL